MARRDIWWEVTACILGIGSAFLAVCVVWNGIPG
jgi:hypothetical protein